MRRVLQLCALAGIVLVSSEGLPCGGGFGEELVIKRKQRIAIAYDGKNETYLFCPDFCGQAHEFGLVLPLPGGLVDAPELADPLVLTHLANLSAPTVETRCTEVWEGGQEGEGEGEGEGVEVVQAGQVGIFDWVLLRADDVQAFTEWLDTNGFPYDDSALPLFGHYVERGWYFVAFRVTASETAPPPDTRLCGSLGPLLLRFAAPAPVLPARIAAAGGSPVRVLLWEVFLLLEQQQRVRGLQEQVSSRLTYSGTVDPELLKRYPSAATMATADDRLTRLELSFAPSALTDDIVFEPDPTPHDYRAHVINYYYQEQCQPRPDLGVADAGVDAPDLAAGSSPDAAPHDLGDDGIPGSSGQGPGGRHEVRSGCACAAQGGGGAPFAFGRVLLLGVLVGLVRRGVA